MSKLLLQRRQPLSIFCHQTVRVEKKNPIDGFFLGQAFLHHSLNQ